MLGGMSHTPFRPEEAQPVTLHWSEREVAAPDFRETELDTGQGHDLWPTRPVHQLAPEA